MSVERSVSRVGNKVFLDTENDGHTFLNRGAEPSSEEIVKVDERGIHLVGGARFTSSSGHLEEQARAYFEQIASESKSN